MPPTRAHQSPLRKALIAGEKCPIRRDLESRMERMEFTITKAINRIGEVGRTVPVSRWDGQTRRIDPARRGRLALPVISRWERRNPGGSLRAQRRGNSCEFRFRSGRFVAIRGSEANSWPFASTLCANLCQRSASVVICVGIVSFLPLLASSIPKVERVSRPVSRSTGPSRKRAGRPVLLSRHSAVRWRRGRLHHKRLFSVRAHLPKRSEFVAIRVFPLRQSVPAKRICGHLRWDRELSPSPCVINP